MKLLEIVMGAQSMANLWKSFMKLLEIKLKENIWKPMTIYEHVWNYIKNLGNSMKPYQKKWKIIKIYKESLMNIIGNPNRKYMKTNDNLWKLKWTLHKKILEIQWTIQTKLKIIKINENLHEIIENLIENIWTPIKIYENCTEITSTILEIQWKHIQT